TCVLCLPTMTEDRLLDGARTAVMHETIPTRQSPQGRRAELVPRCESLLYPIARVYVVKQQVREQVDRFVPQRFRDVRGVAGLHLGHMATGTPNITKHLLSLLHLRSARTPRRWG